MYIQYISAIYICMYIRMYVLHLSLSLSLSLSLTLSLSLSHLLIINKTSLSPTPVPGAVLQMHDHHRRQLGATLPPHALGTPMPTSDYAVQEAWSAPVAVPWRPARM